MSRLRSRILSQFGHPSGALGARCRTGRRQQDGSAGLVITGHTFVQDVRCGYYELTDAEPADRRLAAAFDELAVAIRPRRR
jgi:hypothetical protein